ncbi:MAG: DUF4340 domain-containing protein [Bacteroidales bacterium]|nr:DUF4340 domain-containing protein [Bacteroidales bacterium]MBR5780690.1 DUF4340 domain-containing protein [Bacteroidales bacterium]
MKKNSIAIVITSVLIVIACLLLWNNRYLTTLRGEAYDFTVRDTASITKMFFADKSGNQVLLKRTEKGWTVNDKYNAQPVMVDNMLYTLDKLRIKMPVSLASHDNVITRMAGTNTKVEIYQIVPRINLFNKVKLFPHEKLTKVFYIGDVTQDNNGTYVLKEGADKAYIVHLHGFRGFISSRFSANPEDWRDHMIFSYDINDISSIKLEFNNQAEKGYVLNEIGHYLYEMKSLNDGSNIDFDTIRVLNLLTSFKDVRFEAFLSDIATERRDSIINSPYQERLTVVTKDGHEDVITTYTMKINADAFGIIEDDWDDDPDHKYAYIENNKELVMIQDFAFGKLLNPAEYYKKGYIAPQRKIFIEELDEIPSSTTTPW